MLDRATEWWACQTKELDTDWRAPMVRVCFGVLLAAGVVVQALAPHTPVVAVASVTIFVVVMFGAIALNRRARHLREDVESDGG